MNVITIIVLLFLIAKIMEGYKRGMVKEIVSFVSLLFLCAFVMLMAWGLKSYVQKETMAIVLVLILLGVLGIAHHLISLILLPAKILAKLPVIKWVNKLLGMVIGALEVPVFLWVLFALVMLFQEHLGVLGDLVISGISKNPILDWLYYHNILVKWLYTLPVSGFSL
jgi:uncharacterized membrane protein required for colicin V production